MSNPLFENECIRCGAPVVDITSQWCMCTKCTNKTKEGVLKARQRKKEDKGSPRRIQMWFPKLKRTV